MLIPLAEARQTVAAALPITVLRAAPDALHPHWLRDTGHYFLGAVPLRGLKRSGQWHVDDTDLAPAVRALAETAGDPGRLIPAGLPWSGLERTDTSRDDWRLAVRWELLCRAAAARPRKKPADLLDAGLDPVAQREAVKAIGRALARCDPPRSGPLAIGGITVMDLVKRRSGSWCVPAGWAAVLDGWQRSRLELLAEARRCAGCGALAADRGQEWDWRSSGADGWVTRCPDCSVSGFPVYGGTMRGVPYASERRRATRADGYLCVVCGLRRATDWDHCHDHGFVRGPVCAGCNQSEARHHGLWRRFDGSDRRTTRHLLHCQGCRSATTLPRRYLAALVTDRLRRTERHARCQAPPAVELTDLAEQGFKAALHCPNHPLRPASWEVEVDGETVAGWVRSLLAEHG